ncbi:MAG: hypothetical protein IKF71_02580 [Bacilli bacterium]|nr:hypothetical protein [Bacilli bacterium]
MIIKLLKGQLSISTKNLYCAELREYQETREGRKVIVSPIPYYPRRFVLVRKKDNGYHCRYKDIFTRSKYKLFSDTNCDFGETVVCYLNPACTTKPRMKYKEAEELFENLNDSLHRRH